MIHKEIMQEATSGVTAIFNKYFSSESKFAQKSSEDGVVRTFIKAHKAKEKIDDVVNILEDTESLKKFGIPIDTSVDVELVPEPIDKKYVPIVVMDEENEYYKKKGYAHVLNLAKYGSATTKEAFTIKPSDLVEEEKNYTSESVIGDIEKSLNRKTRGIPEDMKSMIMQFLDSVYSGDRLWVENSKKYQNAITNYVGEVMGPIALVENNFITGDYDTANKFLLEPFNLSIEDMEFKFPAAKNNPLADSVLIKNEVEVQISSKAGQGAAASVKSLTDILDNLPDHILKQLNDTFSKDIDNLNIIRDNNQIMGPLELGVRYDIISNKQKNTIVSLIKNKEKVVPDEFIDITDKVKANTDNLNYNAGYHILSVIANDVAEEVNKSDTFSEMVRGVLNNSSVIQLHFKVKTKGEDLAVESFKVKYPPKFDGLIFLDSKKNYFSSGIKGKYTFKLK